MPIDLLKGNDLANSLGPSPKGTTPIGILRSNLDDHDNLLTYLVWVRDSKPMQCGTKA